MVSDIRIATSLLEGSGRPVNGSVDLYLVFDLIVGVSPANLQGLDPKRAVAVVSTGRTPTGDMVSHVDKSYPNQVAMLSAIKALVRAEHTQSVDALRVTSALFGDTATANILLLGVAFQAGAMPLSAGAIERAIELNGVAVEVNTLAFRWGRMVVANPARVRALMPGRPGWAPHADRGDHRGADTNTNADADADAKGAARRRDAVDVLIAGVTDEPHSELARLLRFRIADLIDYQDLRYAKRYVRLVDYVGKTEQRVDPKSSALCEAVAANLYKLMACKDEYEVARLHLEAAGTPEIEERFGSGAKVSWNLQPPITKRFFGDRKLRLGPWFTPIMRGLRSGKRLRGTVLDPFGRTHIRGLERLLVVEYEAAIRGVMKKLDPASMAGPSTSSAFPTWSAAMRASSLQIWSAMEKRSPRRNSHCAQWSTIR